MRRLILATILIMMGMVASTDLAFAQPAISQPYGLYIPVFGGLAYTPDVNDANGTGIIGTLRYKTVISHDGSYNPPYLAGAGLGYKNGPFRYEAVFQYMRSSYRDHSVAGIKIPGFSGNTKVSAGMANIFYDFDQFHSNSGWVMYLGGGVGFADVENEANFILTSRDSENKFALQGIGGMGYHFCQQAMGFIQYHYFVTPSDVNFTGKRYQNHMLTAGLDIYLSA